VGYKERTDGLPESPSTVVLFYLIVCRFLENKAFSEAAKQQWENSKYP
jgi:hypothetical protein